MKRIITGISVQLIAYYVGDPAGTAIARVKVAASWGATFSPTNGGTLTLSGPNAAQALAIPSSDGSFKLVSTIAVPLNWSPYLSLTAKQPGFANSPYTAGPYAFAPSVPASPPAATLTLVVTPTAPSIPSTTPKGSVVATLRASWSDGSAFTGSFIFVAPNFDYGGVYAITLNPDRTGQLIVNPNGPGVGSAGGSVEHVTIEATQ